MRLYHFGLVTLMLGSALALTGCHEPYHGESVSVSYNSGGYYHGRPYYGHNYHRPVVVMPPRHVVVVPPRHGYGHDRRDDRHYKDHDRHTPGRPHDPGRYRDPGRY